MKEKTEQRMVLILNEMMERQREIRIGEDAKKRLSELREELEKLSAKYIGVI